MRHRPVRARKNVVFLLPFAPLLVPAFVGGAGLYFAGKVAKTAMEPYINTPAVLGGGVGYVAAAVAKQSVGVQAGAALVGYLGGLLIGNALTKKIDAQKKEEEARAISAAAQTIMAEEGVKTTADAQKIAEWRKWCKDHSLLAYATPQCYYY
jgi:hypothetical protein